MAANNTIFVKGRGIGKEAQAGGAILPGALLKLNSSGKVIAHNIAGGFASRIFARENELAGMGISEAYAADDTVFYESANSGFEINAYVAPSAAAIVVGDFLVSDGTGGLKKASAAGDVGASPSEATIEAALAIADDDVIAVALEAVDNSGDASRRKRILVEIL